MSKSDLSSDDDKFIENQSVSKLEHMFPITSYDITTKSDRNCTVFLLGDTVSNHTRLALNDAVLALTALEDYLIKSDGENKFHDISPKMLDNLYESQETSSQLFNSCMKLIEKINKNY